MTHKVTEIAEQPNDKMVTICGLITATKQIPTKKDPSKFIRFVTIEDLTGKIDVICFNNKLAEFGSFLEPEQRVIVSGKVNRRSDEEAPSILVENVKPVDNSNIFTIELLDDLKYEELFFLKQLLCENKGSDPVMIKMRDDTGEVRVLTASMFWVETTNDLINTLKKKFDKRVELTVKSMDTNVRDGD